jgi:hypothetical protein
LAIADATLPTPLSHWARCAAELTWAMLQQILPVIAKMLPPATWLVVVVRFSPSPSSPIQEAL